jgi:predicted CXXCH cytochrome family protein
MLVVLVAVAGLVWLLRSARAVGVDLERPLSLHGASYVGSRSCKPCHPGNYASWHRTFHRTMTQQASKASVLGDFAHGRFDYMGVQARMQRDPQGRFVMEFSRRGGLEHWSATVERTVGSRRYQQYLARDRDLYYRLPLAWNIEERRWMHMNGAFLTPDPSPSEPGAAIERSDYDRHVTRWNDNCIYCHNVAPNPGLDSASGRFDSTVAELGIACEACHGPASHHVERNRDPLRRFALHLSGRADPTIANPARLTPARSAQVCGHCHGQRMAPDIERVQREGDRFVPGDDLARYSRPLVRDSMQNGERGVFASRFWPDGTARLTAYEYQGLLQSACARRGELTCTSCHGMHEGDPRGQIRVERVGDAACTGCHSQLASDRSKASHSHHAASGEGARCVNCHMPRIVYGLVGAHRSHRIDSPRVEPSAQQGHPDACTLCHVDKPRAWAAESLQRWSGKNPAPSPASVPEVARLLLAGDPIERAIAADALGRTEASAASAPVQERLGLLLDTLQDDGYPAVRAIAWRSLRSLLAEHYPQALPKVTALTPTDTREARARSLAAVTAALPQGAVRAPQAELGALRAEAKDPGIFIGE